MKLFREFALLPAILLMLLSQPALADNLCNAACNLHIDFTQSGSLKAVAALTITFGSGGVINDGAVATGYSAGETLLLNAGDALVFDAGGVLDLGDGGNIDYIAMNLLVDGDISIAAVEGTGSISFHGDSRITLYGSMTLDSDAIISTQLDLSSDASLTTGSGTFTVDTGGLIILSNSLILPDSEITLTPDQINQPLPGTEIDPGSVTLLSQSDLIHLEGVTFPVGNGSTCTVHNGKCYDVTGTEYRVDNGIFTPENGNSGTFNLFHIFFLFLLYLSSTLRALIMRKKRDADFQC